MAFQERLSRAAAVDRPVLLVGERGTGKELAAARLHFLSSRWGGPLVTLNCAALAPSLLESELFGHEAGAYTGATGARQGRFEAADEGTLFLDEIGLIPMVVQEKILRVVEYRRFERVGSSRPTEVDVRTIGATNADLPALAAAGKFKQDLLDRLSFEVVFLPPLRKRSGDVSLLARHFAARMAMELGRGEIPTFSRSAMSALEGHPWPGNVRELKNVVERAVYRCPGERVETIEFDPFRSQDPGAAGFGGGAPGAAAGPGRGGPKASSAGGGARAGAGDEGGDGADRARFTFRYGHEPLRDALRRIEREAVGAAMDEAKHHQRRAAARLGMSYHQFRNLLRKHRDDDGGVSGDGG